MKILDYLDPNAIFVDLQSDDKIGVLKELATPFIDSNDQESGELLKVLMERERLGSTGIGNGIGIPHGRIKDLDAIKIGIGISRRGIDFESIDGRPTHIFFLILTPESFADHYLRLLATISRYLKDDSFKQALQKAQDSKAITEIIKAKDCT